MLKKLFHLVLILVALCAGLYGIGFFLLPFLGQPGGMIEIGVFNPDGTINLTPRGYWGLGRTLGILLGGYVGFRYFFREVGLPILEMYRRC